MLDGDRSLGSFWVVRDVMMQDHAVRNRAGAAGKGPKQDYLNMGPGRPPRQPPCNLF